MNREMGAAPEPAHGWLRTCWLVLVAAYGPPRAAGRAYRKLTDTNPGRWT
jgi:hypothetical protein